MRSGRFAMMMVVALALLPMSAIAQFQPQGFTSPTAAALARYGDVPVNTFTGSVNPTIPLGSVAFADISVPLALSYASSGFKPDEYAGWAGSGWSLAAGGLITRSVLGLPDEHPNGYLATGFDLYEADPDLTEFVVHMLAGDRDGQPDVFHFNFMGKVGKFVFSFDWADSTDPDRVVVLPLQQVDFRITPIFHTTTEWLGQSFDYRPIIGWVVTDEAGYTYRFDQTEISRTLSADASGMVITGSERRYVSGWYLSQVRSPISGSTIRFDYARHSESETHQSFQYELTVGMTSSKGFSLHYTQSVRPVAIVSATDSVVIRTTARYRHTFTYDGRNQLRSADYEYWNGSTWADKYDYDIGWIGYNRDGGITLMNRQNGGESSFMDLEFVYETGSNRLDYVWDHNSTYYDAQMSHDRNGNIISDRGISATTYDWRDLPTSITSSLTYPFTPTTHTYRYDHEGRRVFSSVDSCGTTNDRRRTTDAVKRADAWS